VKTITLDYDTYKQELTLAKIEGTSVVSNLKEKLTEILADIDSYSGERNYQAIVKISKLLQEITSTEKFL